MKNTAFHKIVLGALTLLCSNVLGLARTELDLGFPASATPYDAYMYPVKQVLTRLASEETSMDRVRRLMRDGREFRYSFTSPYVAATPDVTAATRSGDCKAKALWLADQLKMNPFVL
jgi:transglutaminase-like putative cysteine protease